MFQTVSWHGVEPSAPRSFVRCLRDPIQPGPCRPGSIGELRADEVFDVDTGHTPSQSEPELLADLLEAVASATTSGRPRRSP